MTPESLDCLFIHPSANLNKPKYIIVPMGMIGLMNEIENRGYTVKLINHGLELSLNHAFSLEELLKTFFPKIVAIGLHWHEHSYSTIKISQMIKRLYPECLIICGGFTASYFSEEIVNGYKSIDIIIRGDADVIFPAMISNFIEKKEIIDHENIITNKQKIVPYQLQASVDSHFNEMNHTDIFSMLHWESYLKVSIDRHNNSWFWNSFWYPIARGCNFECSYCGGNKNAQMDIYRRPKVTFKSIKKVISELKRLQKLGIHIINFSHDLELANKQYWKKLFLEIQDNNLEFGSYLEIWQLSSKEFLQDFINTFNRNFSSVAITVLTANEIVREKNGKIFTNSQLFEILAVLEELYIPYVLYFSSGLPFETQQTILEIPKLIEIIMKNFHPKSIITTTLTLDPCSPMIYEREKYKVIPHFINFDDYYIRTLNRSNNLDYDRLGYHTQFLDQQAILQQQEMWNELLQKYQVDFKVNESLTQYISFI